MKPISLSRRALRLCLGALALAASAQAAAELVLYDNDDFNGQPGRYAGKDSNLSRSGFNDRASSAVVRSGTWQLCSDADYQGQCITLNPGSYRSLRDMSMNDRVSSVRPLSPGVALPGWTGGSAAVQFFENSDYGGRSITSAGSANLSQQGFNDRASSVVIRSGRWEFCSDADFRGRCVVLGPGSHAQLSAMSLNDEITSVRPVGVPAVPPGTPPFGGTDAYRGNQPTVTSASHDAEVADILFGGSQAGRVTFPDGCVVYYNAEGQRLQNLPSCNGQQIPLADAAMARQRAAQGLGSASGEHPWVAPQPPGFAGHANSPPEVILNSNREGEVVFGNGCVAYYNAQGRRYQQQPACKNAQLRRADEAMAARRREQGL